MALQRKKTFLEEPVQPPSKKPRLEPAEQDAAPPAGGGAPSAERDAAPPAERDAAPPAGGGAPPAERDADSAEHDAAPSQGTLSQETLIMGAGSPLDDA